jgi:hypothetical protein
MVYVHGKDNAAREGQRMLTQARSPDNLGREIIMKLKWQKRFFVLDENETGRSKEYLESLPQEEIDALYSMRLCRPRNVIVSIVWTVYCKISWVLAPLRWKINGWLGKYDDLPKNGVLYIVQEDGTLKEAGK